VEATPSPTTETHVEAMVPLMVSQHAARLLHADPITVPVPLPVPASPQPPVVCNDTSSALQVTATPDATISRHAGCCSEGPDAQHVARFWQAVPALEPPNVEVHAVTIPNSAAKQAIEELRVMGIPPVNTGARVPERIMRRMACAARGVESSVGTTACGPRDDPQSLKWNRGARAKHRLARGLSLLSPRQS
jgi:hypothetical protein